MTWQCGICDVEHDEIPTCFGAEAPWRSFVPTGEFDQRVELTADQCVIDEQYFFMRGHIQIPITGHSEPFAFSVWASVSESSFRHITSRWNESDRITDATYFGWLSTSLPTYPDTMNLKLNVHMRAPGLTPLFELEPTDHPLALDQRNGISAAQWHNRALELLAG